jgi:hypothetical protein
MDREQAINILDKFDFFQGQRAGRELWAEKPFEVQEEDLKNFSKDVASLKTFIKKLTEDNERLRADTVRKIHSEIEKRCIKGGIYPAFVKSTIDQIAKEIIDT